MINKLTFLHINIRSIVSTAKQLELQQLLAANPSEFISLNETWLKPHNDFSLEGYQMIRSDRTHKKGGGSALLIRNNIPGNEIKISNNNINSNAVGFEIECGSHSLAIFSIYCSPLTPLNNNLLEHICTKYKYFIILGDLNANNHMWNCKSYNKKGHDLENLINRFNLQIMNSKTPTYKRSKNVLDLSICSNSLASYSYTHKVLKSQISDHQPTFTTIKGINPKRESLTFKKLI